MSASPGLFISNTNTQHKAKDRRMQPEVKSKKKTLIRGKSLHVESSHLQPAVNGDASQESLMDECIFPSPVAISAEEAIRETQCHFVRNIGRDVLQCGGNFDDCSEDGLHSNYLNSRQPLRREVEKPPRLQKQMSRERAYSINRQASWSDPIQCNGDSQSQGSGSECLDSTGVDVNTFLVKALQSNPRDRNILFKLEQDMVKFCRSNESFMRFPEMTSYHRMLVHRVAAYFGMDHNIDSKGKSVIINKTEFTRIPEKKFRDFIIAGEENGNGREEDGRRSILKRMKNCQSLDHVERHNNRDKNWKESGQRSFEEREDLYERARARIFQEGPRSDKLRFKERSVSQWKSRPWNSVDVDYHPEREREVSVSPLIAHGPPNKSNGLSGMTILSRPNNLKKDSISSSSSTSSLFQAHQSDTQSDNDVNHEQDHHLNMQNTLQPSLTVPYVNMEGQPVFPQPTPIFLPSYATAPLCYPPNPILHKDPRMHPPQDMNGYVQNDVLQADGLMINPPMNVYQPPNRVFYPYHAFQLPYYAYPLQPIQNPGSVPAQSLQMNGHPHDVETELANLKLKANDNSDEVGSSHMSDPNSIDENIAKTPTPSLSLEQELPCNNLSANYDLKTSTGSEEIESVSSVSASTSIFSHDSSATDNAKPFDKESRMTFEDDIEKNCPEQQLESSNVNENVCTTVSTCLGSITYYTAETSQLPLQTGSSGQAIYGAPPTYPSNLVPYAFNGFDGKFYQSMIGPRSVESLPEYYLQGNTSAGPGFGSLVSGFVPPPICYMVNNPRMGPYAVPFQGMPMMYAPPPTPGGYIQPMMQPVVDHFPSKNCDTNNLDLESQQSCINDDSDLSLYPLKLLFDVVDVNAWEIKAFATRCEAEIVYLATNDKESSRKIFFLFPSLVAAARAKEEAQKSEIFRFSEATETEKLDLVKNQESN